MRLLALCTHCVSIQQCHACTPCGSKPARAPGTTPAMLTQLLTCHKQGPRLAGPVHQTVRFNRHTKTASLCPLLLTLRPAHCLLRTACPPQAPAAACCLSPSSCLCCSLPCVCCGPSPCQRLPGPPPSGSQSPEGPAWVLRRRWQRQTGQARLTAVPPAQPPPGGRPLLPAPARPQRANAGRLCSLEQEGTRYRRGGGIAGEQDDVQPHLDAADSLLCLSCAA